MPYIPDLIPEKDRVLVEYFKQAARRDNTNSSRQSVVAIVFAMLSFFLALINFQHPVVMTILAMVGVVILPSSRRWIENLLTFEFTLRLQIICCILFFIGIFYFDQKYKSNDALAAQQNEIETQKDIAKQKAITEADEKRKSHLAVLLTQSGDLLIKKRPQSVTIILDSALSIAVTPPELSEIARQRHEAKLIDCDNLVNSGRYREASALLSEAIVENEKDDKAILARAICLIRLGDIRNAVNDLRQAIALGNSKAGQLYDQVNPLQQRIVNYLTRCCDGSLSPSNAKGRGACSHHGGVCDWNEPEYETYRKY